MSEIGFHGHDGVLRWLSAGGAECDLDRVDIAAEVRSTALRLNISSDHPGCACAVIIGLIADRSSLKCLSHICVSTWLLCGFALIGG
jgi:hypothetical protein